MGQQSFAADGHTKSQDVVGERSGSGCAPYRLSGIFAVSAPLAPAAEINATAVVRLLRARNNTALSVRSVQWFADSSYALDVAAFRARVISNAENYWRLVLAGEFLPDKRPYTTSRDLGSLVGHATFDALTRLESLSCHSAVSALIRREHRAQHALLPTVASELRVFEGVFILVRTRLDLPWSEDGMMSDACVTCHASECGWWETKDVRAAAHQ